MTFFLYHDIIRAAKRDKGYTRVKATGIVRKVDELGRIVLPAELRRTLSIAEKDPLEIYVDGGSIILQKHEERCVFCGGSEDLRTVLGKNICGSFLSRLKKTRT